MNELRIGDAPAEPAVVAPPHVVDGNKEGEVVVDPSKEITPEAKKEGEKKPERPSWLPEKFQTPEAMAEAYAALEKKQGAAPEPKTPVTPTESKGLDMAALEQEWVKTEGQLSEASLKALKDRGLTTEVVKAYVAGQQAEASKARAEFISIAGSEEQLTAVLGWAKDGLSEKELAAYNGALDRGDGETATMLFELMNARYIQANGKDPKLVTGATVPGGAGVKPFESWAQVEREMAKPEYKQDQAFRDKVAKRIAVSTAF